MLISTSEIKEHLRTSWLTQNESIGCIYSRWGPNFDTQLEATFIGQLTVGVVLLSIFELCPKLSDV